jgi:hypothetical protein
MATINAVLQSRAVDGGHAIEVDFTLDDASTHTLKIPYERIAQAVHAISNAASVAETQQKVAASGQPRFAVIAPYYATNVRTGQSSDGRILLGFVTSQGPVEVAMTSDLARKTIERLTFELGQLGKQQFPKPS